MTLKQFASWHGRGGVETVLTEHHRNSARTHHAGTRFGRSSAEFDSTNAAGSSHSGPETTTGKQARAAGVPTAGTPHGPGEIVEKNHEKSMVDLSIVVC